MKLGILVTSIGSFGKKGFYNLQEIGLARALDPLVEEIKIYKLVSKNQLGETLPVSGSLHSTIQMIPSFQIGSNGIPDTQIFDPSLDVLICFSDTQLSLPRVYRWAMKHKIHFIPYAGVLESHSGNWGKRVMMNLAFRSCRRVYQKADYCLAKTPRVREELHKLGAKRVFVAPVGLDLDSEAGKERCSEEMLRKKYGYEAGEKVLLFIGRMTAEKRPMLMLDLFDRIQKEHSEYRLLMVGAGELEEAVKEKVQSQLLVSKVKQIREIANDRIHELYRIADVFINLNQQEIFGMVILEAMYYGCKVVAWRAPGPEFIIEDGKSGWLVDTAEQAVDRILDENDFTECARARIEENFTWERTAEKIGDLVRRIGEYNEHNTGTYTS